MNFSVLNWQNYVVHNNSSLIMTGIHYWHSSRNENCYRTLQEIKYHIIASSWKLSRGGADDSIFAGSAENLTYCQESVLDRQMLST